MCFNIKCSASYNSVVQYHLPYHDYQQCQCFSSLLTVLVLVSFYSKIHTITLSANLCFMLIIVSDIVLLQSTSCYSILPASVTASVFTTVAVIILIVLATSKATDK